MPTVLVIGPYRFYFYSGDRTEPPHIHIGREDRELKAWLEDPVQVAYNRGFAAHEVQKIMRLVLENRDELLASWLLFFRYR